MATAKNKKEETPAIDPAQPTMEELKAQIRAEVEAELREEMDAEYHQQLVKLQEDLDAARAAKPSKEVKGLVELELETPEGKTKKVKIGISDGHPNIRPLKGIPFIVKSELFLKYAAGEQLHEEEIKVLEEEGCTREGAQELLAEMVQAESNMIKILD